MKRICGSCFSCFETSKNNEYKEGTKDKILVGFKESTSRKPKSDSKNLKIPGKSEATNVQEKSASRKQNAKVFVVPEKLKNQNEGITSIPASTEQAVAQEQKGSKVVNFIALGESAGAHDEVKVESKMVTDSHSNEVTNDLPIDSTIPTEPQENEALQDFSEDKISTEPGKPINTSIKPFSQKILTGEPDPPQITDIERAEDKKEESKESENESEINSKIKVKRKLKSLVQNFIVDSCSSGISVAVLNADTGDKTEALFKIDQNVKMFSLQFGNGKADKEFTWAEVASIKLGSQIDGNPINKAELEVEKRKMIKMEVKKDKEIIWLHFGSEEISDNFYACFKILRLADVITKSQGSEDS